MRPAPCHSAPLRAITCLLALGLGHPGARAQQEPALESLRQAREAYARGDLPSAADAYARALTRPDRAPAETVECHLHLGIVQLARGAVDEARRSFAVALALEPELPVPPELPPPHAALFEEVASATPALALTVEPAGEAELRARLQHVPTALDARLEVEGVATPAHAHEATFPTPEGPVRVRALDGAGATLRELRRAAPVPAPRELALEASPGETRDLADADEAPRPLRRNPWLWTGVAVVVLGSVALALGLSLRDSPGFGAP